ncbi:conserved repeat domain protein [Fibrella aestuarina BUZ 2]|uniref:Conserved repeat domain protein n=1 Tax=Fibrella aestuarina BUZ 2 TaxID=1166018 RepID=I0K988_9BACT|nr:SdrD B-like domain-containing protein [Fibrella aestuarina]CCH00691.1 conserved repeat domain protein [Fibrella aestuarina BUZ 2]
MSLFGQTSNYDSDWIQRRNWYRFIIATWLFVGLCTAGYSQSVQLQFNSVVNLPTTTSVVSCSAFTVDMSYGVVSPTTAASDARVILPLRGLTYNSIVTTPDVTTAIVRGTSPNDTLIVVMKSPLAAGSAGTVTANLQFPCGTACSGTTAAVRPYFNATNATVQATTNPVSLTARSVDPGYQINVLSTAYNGSTRRGTYTVRITPTTTPTNYLALTSQAMSLTVPAGVNVITPAGGGTRTNFPTTITGGSFTPTSTTAAGAGGTRIITWTNLPTFYRGGNFDITGVVLEYPPALFPVNSAVVLNSAFSGVLSTSACGTTSGTRSFTQVVTDFSAAPGATGCSSSTLLAGLYNGTVGNGNAIFVGKANQARITLPISNTGNVTLTNLTYTIDIPTNELNATVVGLSGSNGPTGSVAYQTNLNPAYRALGTTPLTIGATRSFSLANGEYVTKVQVTSTSLAAGSNMSVYVNASQLSPLRNGNAVNASPLNTFAIASNATKNTCYGGYTCATTSVTVTAEYSGSAVLNQTCSGSRVIVQPAASLQTFAKTIPVVPSSYVPGTVYQYRVQFTPITAGDTLRNFVLTDVLPASLEYAGNLRYSNSTTYPTSSVTFTSGTSVPVFSRSGQTLTWSWAALPAAAGKIVSPLDHYIFFDVRIRPGTSSNITNCISATATSAYFSSTSACAPAVTLNPLAKIDAIKWVRGDLDRNYTRFPKVGHTTDGGRSDYRFVLVNPGNVAFKNIVLVDIFPWIGDKTIAADYDRLSEWRPQLVQTLRFYTKSSADSAKPASTTIATPANVTVSYSTQTNPCRSEFTPPYSPSGCVANAWTVTPPADLSTVQAIKINIAGPFVAGDTLVFGVSMRSPPGTELGKAAWNSFAYQATRNDNNTILPVAEPNKVGIDVKRFPAIGDYVWMDANANGKQDEPASAGVNGVSVQLWSPGGDGLRGTDDDFLVGTKVTANNADGNPGYYRFDSLFAETYYLRFIAPAGQAFTRQNAAGVSSALDSDPDGVSGWTELTTLDPDEQDFTWDAALCIIPNAGPDQLVCSPITSVKLPDATGLESWTVAAGNPPGASINAQTGQVTGLATGVYRFILTIGGGCVDTVVVDRRPPATATVSNATPCTGESVTLTAGAAGTQATYLWTGPASYSASGPVVVLPAVTSAQTGSYTLKLTDAGCVSTTALTLSVNSPPQLTTQVGSCSATTNQYSVRGSLTVTNPGGATVIITDTDGMRSVSLVVIPTQATTPYALTGLISNGVSHTVTATYGPAYCVPTSQTYVAPVSCSCVVSAAITSAACQPNGTYTNLTDDYIQPVVLANSTQPGAAGRFAVILNANADGTGGTVLNVGGTPYGQAVSVGTPGQFPADNVSMYRLTIRDVSTPACLTTVLTPTVPACSSCAPPACVVPKLERQAVRP